MDAVLPLDLEQRRVDQVEAVRATAERDERAHGEQTSRAAAAAAGGRDEQARSGCAGGEIERSWMRECAAPARERAACDDAAGHEQRQRPPRQASP